MLGVGLDSDDHKRLTTSTIKINSLAKLFR